MIFVETRPTSRVDSGVSRRGFGDVEEEHSAELQLGTVLKTFTMLESRLRGFKALAKGMEAFCDIVQADLDSRGVD